MATPLCAAKVWIQISVSKILKLLAVRLREWGKIVKIFRMQCSQIAQRLAFAKCRNVHLASIRAQIGKAVFKIQMKKCALPNGANATSCSSGWDCSHGVCRKLTASKIYCNNNESTSINCLDTDIYQPICVPNGNAYSCGYACNDTQRECGSGGDVAASNPFVFTGNGPWI